MVHSNNANAVSNSNTSAEQKLYSDGEETLMKIRAAVAQHKLGKEQLLFQM